MEQQQRQEVRPNDEIQDQVFPPVRHRERQADQCQGGEQAIGEIHRSLDKQRLHDRCQLAGQINVLIIGNLIAIDQAAELAGLSSWETIRLREPIDPRAALMAELIAPDSQQTSTNLALPAQLAKTLAQLQRFDDPHHVYALCEPCWRVAPWVLRQ